MVFSLLLFPEVNLNRVWDIIQNLQLLVQELILLQEIGCISLLFGEFNVDGLVIYTHQSDDYAAPLRLRIFICILALANQVEGHLELGGTYYRGHIDVLQFRHNLAENKQWSLRAEHRSLSHELWLELIKRSRVFGLFKVTPTDFWRLLMGRRVYFLSGFRCLLFGRRVNLAMMELHSKVVSRKFAGPLGGHPGMSDYVSHAEALVRLILKHVGHEVFEIHGVIASGFEFRVSGPELIHSVVDDVSVAGIILGSLIEGPLSCVNVKQNYS